MKYYYDNTYDSCITAMNYVIIVKSIASYNYERPTSYQTDIFMDCNNMEPLQRITQFIPNIPN